LADHFERDPGVVGEIEMRDAGGENLEQRLLSEHLGGQGAEVAEVFGLVLGFVVAR